MKRISLFLIKLLWIRTIDWILRQKQISFIPQPSSSFVVRRIGQRWQILGKLRSINGCDASTAETAHITTARLKRVYAKLENTVHNYSELSASKLTMRELYL